MIDLTRKEILSELKKLGISTFTELKTYFREYREYCTRCKINYSSSQLI